MIKTRFNGQDIEIRCYICIDENNSIDAGVECEALENNMAGVIEFFGLMPSIGDGFPTNFGSGYATVIERNFTDVPGRIMFAMKYA
ncbi:MAG: hypothetical protein NVS3B25_35280 [Hymenobacter sp.]